MKKLMIATIVIAAALAALCLVVPSILSVPLCVYLLFQPAPSRLPVPVEGVSPRQLVDTFGGPRSGGRRHKGIDIFAARGRPIRSSTEGIVTRVGEDRLGGRIVMILGPGGKWHYYAHLERYGEVKPGQWIRQGHYIGNVGDSGNARGTPPHLHYGIYGFSGIAIDPYPLLHRGEKG